LHGPRKTKTVALTFDDGPSEYTASVLNVLRSKHVRGTFFELGDLASGRAAIMRRIVRSGNEIANHSTHHGAFPGYTDLVSTNRVIKRATGFTPCLFRPPYGAYNSGTVAVARRAGMKTILWDVDPRDWSRPGTGAIYGAVVSKARPGSIVVMHDGGGPRTQTVAALPRIITTLRRRGYSFATVSDLIGNWTIYRPVG